MIITDILWMAFLFLIPGMASFTVYRHVAGYAIDKLYKFIFYSAVWSILDYGVVELVFGTLIYGIPFGKYLNVWMMFQYKFMDVPIVVIVRVLASGILIAWALGRTARYLRLHCKGLLYTKLWDYYLNYLWKKNKVAVYDYKNRCKYIGVIKNFSYFTSRKELVLRDVEMYSFTKEGKELKRMEGESCIEEVYLQLEDSNFAILNLGKSGVIEGGVPKAEVQEKQEKRAGL